MLIVQHLNRISKLFESRDTFKEEKKRESKLQWLKNRTTCSYITHCVLLWGITLSKLLLRLFPWTIKCLPIAGMQIFTALIPPTAAIYDVCFIMTSHSEPSNCSTITCAASLSYYVSHSLLLLPPGLARFLCLACSLCVSEPLYDKSSPPCMLYWSRQASAKMPQTIVSEGCVGAFRRRGGFFNSTPSRSPHIAIYQC